MFRSICFYQHPEARHEIDAWRVTISTRIVDSRQGATGASGLSVEIVEIVRLDGRLEELFLVPLDSASADEAWRRLAKERWQKVLYFGKIMGAEAVLLIATAMPASAEESVATFNRES